VDAAVFAAGDVQEFLLRILRERDVPDGTQAEGLVFNERFLHESAIGFANLKAVVYAMADVQQIVAAKHGAANGAGKLLGR
jgi:hypothetical protein